MSWGKINWGSGTKGSANCCGLEIFHADATDETRICHNKICPLILLGQFWFCLPVQKGRK